MLKEKNPEKPKPIRNINMVIGRDYLITVPRSGKGTEKRLVKGKVVQETEKLITIRTKNYTTSFTRWELDKYKVMEA